ncbi:Hypothetical predicted protein, partial [Pelobates cultripes]
MAPMYANAYMFQYEQQNILSEYGHLIKGYYHYIDDNLIVWQGMEQQALDMIQTINNLRSPVWMTSNISYDWVYYLDLEISVNN